MCFLDYWITLVGVQLIVLLVNIDLLHIFAASKLEVRDVSLTEELPASVSQMLAWEEVRIVK